MPPIVSKQQTLALRLCVGLACAALIPGLLGADPFATDSPQPLALQAPQHMDVAQRDSRQGVALETGRENGNEVERRTARYKDGGKAEQVTEVLSPLPGGHPLKILKNKWNRAGELTYTQQETDSLDSSGAQTGGKRDSKSLEQGRTVKETWEIWNESMNGWLVTKTSTVTYYADGDMKERVTENIAANTKSDEVWGSKHEHGRVKTVRHWDAAAKAWGNR